MLPCVWKYPLKNDQRKEQRDFVALRTRSTTVYRAPDCFVTNFLKIMIEA